MIKYRISLESKYEDVNTFYGELEFPVEWGTPRFENTMSTILYWIDIPQVSSDGVFKFSGVYPGGFKSKEENLVLFNIIWEDATAEELPVLKTKTDLFYRNEKTAPSAYQARFLTEPLNVLEEEILAPDTIAPTIVSATQVTDPSGASGLVLQVSDNNGGVPSIEVQYGYPLVNEWQVTDHWIDTPDLDQAFSVRVTDEVGNQTLQRFNMEGVEFFVKWVMLPSLFILTLLLLLALKRFLGHHNNRMHHSH
jgi:hypothetical protein